MTTTVVWTATQEAQVSGGVFSENNPIGVFPGTDASGWILDSATGQTLRFATVGSTQRVLESPIITSWTVEFAVVRLAGGAGISTCVFELGLVAEAAAANYSQALLPWSRGETSLGFLSSTVPVAPNPSLELSFTPSSDLLITARALVTSRSNWNGKLAISMRQLSGDPTQIKQLGLELTTFQDPFFNGLIGGPIGPGVRVVRDGRFGMPAMSNELIRDGDQHGLFVRAGDWDPEDETASYRPRPGEGSTHDEVPDL